jgi:hypothetical protein
VTHPINPGSELVQQWRSELPTGTFDGYCWPHREFDLCVRAAQWGADQELDACCAIARVDPVCGTKHQRNMLVQHIREQRRPKPPSAKEQALFALAVLTSADETCSIAEIQQHWHSIRRALEALPE